jgi:CHAD domain-containing protein
MVKELTAEERAILTAIAEREQVMLARRAKIVLGGDAGLTPEQIAVEVNLTARTIELWLQSYSQHGLGIFPDDVLADAVQAAGAGAEAEADSLLVETGPPAMEGAVLGVPGGDHGPLTLEELCQRQGVDMAHARQVAQTAVELFDLTESAHQLDASYREVAYQAGLAVDIGRAGGKARHHTHGRDILLEQPLSGVGDDERGLIAVCAAFHRKTWRPARLEDEPAYLALPGEQQPVALALAALVRMADGLDYSKTQTSRLGPAGVDADATCIPVYGPQADLDAARAMKKADLWNALSGIPIHFSPRVEAEAEGFAAAQVALPGVKPGDLMSEAGRKILRVQYRRMLLEEPGTRLGENMEALHQMRVATRRMRSALRLFTPYYDEDAVRLLRRGMRRTGRALGRVRDLDIFMAHVQDYLAALPVERQGELDIPLAYWEKRHRRAQEKMLAYLDGGRYQEFVELMGRFANTRGLGSLDAGDTTSHGERRVKYVIPRVIYQQYEAIRAYESLLRGASITLYHELRIDAKRLRYTLEFFQEVLGPEVEPVIGALIAVQDHLGALHDADVTQLHLRRDMEKLLKSSGKRQKNRNGGGEQPEIGGIVAYLENRELEIERLVATFPTVWEAVIAPETRRSLALAISIL